MKRLIVILYLIPLFTQAQNTLLYEVSKKGVKQKSYLFGTMHVQDDRAFAFNDSVLWAIDQCKKTAFELNLDQNELAKSMSRKNFKELIDTAFITRLTTFVQTDFLPTLMDNMTPGELSSKISTQILPAYFDLLKSKMNTNQRQAFVDMYLQDYARDNGKQIIGIETYTEQIIAIIGDIKNYQFDDKQLSNKIVNYLKNKEIKLNLVEILSGTDEMVDFYSKGDLVGLCNYVTDPEVSNAFTTKLYERLLINRNDIMYERTKDDVKKGATFIAVGAGHLCGNNGLLAQYKKAGYTIRPMNLSSNYRRAYQWKKLDTEIYTVDLPQGVNLSEHTGVYASMYGKDEKATRIYTAKGTATFNIEYVYSSEHIEEEYYDYEDAIEMAEYEEVEEAMEEEDIVVYELADEKIVETTESEDVIIEEIEVYEEVSEDEEIIYYEEVEKNAEEVESELDPIQNESDADYELDAYEMDDEEYETYTPPKSRKDRMNEYLTEEQISYMKEVGDSIQKQFKSEMGGIMKNSMDLYKVAKDTILSGGKTLYYQSGMLGGTTLKMLIPMPEGNYELTISGDPQLLKSEDLYRFFTSFRLKE